MNALRGTISERSRGRRPSFLVIGSQKAGTTSLYQVLGDHPDIYMPPTKEVNFFFREELYERGMGYYERVFAGAPPAVALIGEASPGYVCHPAAPARIRHHLPDVRLILTVRHPVDRAWSQYWDNRRELEVQMTFEEAARKALHERWWPGQLGYFSRGVYINYIRDYLRHFNRSRLHVVVMEDLKSRPEAVYRGIFEFLGADPDRAALDTRRRGNPFAVWRNPVYRWFFDHPRQTRFLPRRAKRALCRGRRRESRYPAMDPTVRTRLLEFYAPYNAELEAFLGRSLESWRR